MTRIIGDVAAVDRVPTEGTVIVQSVEMRPGATLVVTGEPQPYPITAGRFVVEDAEPGPTRFIIQGGGAHHEVRVTVPDQPEVTFLELLESVFEWEPSILAQGAALLASAREAAAAAEASADRIGSAEQVEQWVRSAGEDAAAADASASAAADSESVAATKAGETSASASAAKTSEDNAKASEDSAAASAGAVASDRAAAGVSAAAAKSSEDAAKASESAAKASETNAASSATASANSRDSAQAYAGGAQTQAQAAQASAGTATTKSGEASLSAAAAKDSEGKAKDSETNAAASADSATESKDAAAGSASAAKTSEENAKASESAAETSETNAAASAATAVSARDSALASADTAQTQAHEAESQGNRAKTEADRAAASAAEAAETTSSGIPDATASMKGKVLLAGDLGGTADAPTVPKLASKADLVGGQVPTSQLPSVALVKPNSVTDRAGMLALTAQEGDVAVITAGTDRGTYMLGQGAPTAFASWVRLTSPDAPVQSVNGQTGTVNLNAANVGAALASHTHTVAQVTGLQSALDGKASASNRPPVEVVSALPANPVAGTLYLVQEA